MNAPKTPNRSETATISSEALVGLGITIAALGLLAVLLGWAEQMRAVPSVAIWWLCFGGSSVVLGILIAAVARVRKRP